VNVSSGTGSLLYSQRKGHKMVVVLSKLFYFHIPRETIVIVVTNIDAYMNLYVFDVLVEFRTLFYLSSMKMVLVTPLSKTLALSP